jgi:hypothetical protein
MVFESVVVNLVNTYLGKYIKDLDSSNLDLGIWRGMLLPSLKYLPMLTYFNDWTLRFI